MEKHITKFFLVYLILPGCIIVNAFGIAWGIISWEYVFTEGGIKIGPMFRNLTSTTALSVMAGFGVMALYGAIRQEEDVTKFIKNLGEETTKTGIDRGVTFQLILLAGSLSVLILIPNEIYERFLR